MNTDLMAKAVALHRASREQSAVDYRDKSKVRLRTIVRKKMMTGLIGTLARLEDRFAEHPDWPKIRNEILNHGHAQIRAVEKELDEYEVRWLRHTASITNQTKNEDERSE